MPVCWLKATWCSFPATRLLRLFLPQHICWRLFPPPQDVCWRLFFPQDVCWRLFFPQDVCWRLFFPQDVCWRLFFPPRCLLKVIFSPKMSVEGYFPQDVCWRLFSPRCLLKAIFSPRCLLKAIFPKMSVEGYFPVHDVDTSGRCLLKTAWCSFWQMSLKDYVMQVLLYCVVAFKLSARWMQK